MRHCKILLGLLVLSAVLIWGILSWPRTYPLNPVVGRLHSLLRPFPDTYQTCYLSDEMLEASREARYRLDIQLVEVPYRRDKCEVPSISGYLNHIEEFMFKEEVQGCVGGCTLQFPIIEITEGQTSHSLSNYQINVTKNNDRFVLEYSFGTGFTYSQEFVLPLGETFVISFGEHSMQKLTDPMLPFAPSRLQPRLMFQMERLLMLKYQEIEPVALK